MQTILNHIENELIYNDSLDKHFISLEAFHTFSINRSTFDHINNMEGNIVSNDSLRRSVSKFYTHVVNLYKEIEDRVLQEHYMNYLKPMMISEFQTYRRNSLKPRNFVAFTRNKDNIQVLNYTVVLFERIITTQNLLLKELDLLDESIERELSILDNDFGNNNPTT